MNRWLSSLAGLLLLAACSGGQQSDEAPSDDYVRQLARSAAQAIAVADHADTLKLQHSLVEAHALRSELLLQGHEESAELFDEYLREELTAIDPDVAHAVFH